MAEGSQLGVQQKESGFPFFVMLTKDGKNICRVKCPKPPDLMPPIWDITIYIKRDKLPAGLPSTQIRLANEDKHQKKEWGLFLDFLKQNNKAAFAETDRGQFYILPPPGKDDNYAVVIYDRHHRHHTTLRQPKSDIKKGNGRFHSVHRTRGFANTCVQERLLSDESATCRNEDQGSPNCMSGETVRNDHALQSRIETCSRSGRSALVEMGPGRNYVCAHPSYLKTLGQAHSGWIFGAVAELVDNSRDAKATTLEISIDMIFSHTAHKEIPMLAVIDDGHGMSHEEILKMVSFGRKQPDADDPDCIGRYGVGFKTGAMRLGKDALVLTQTTTSRSIAFLSQSFNEGKDNIEIPIVTYCRREQHMEFDTSVQSVPLSKANLRAIMDFSPFTKYLIGEKAGLFKKKTGTQIYIWNLDEWGSKYCLEWENGMNGGSSFHMGDIRISSRRPRSRPGQMTREVPIDYSLRSYLEVIFLDPRMKIFVQGSLVKTRPLAKFLHKTTVENGIVSGKPVQLTLGRSQLDLELGNCGIFLYWRGRLIEAYKRVGSMIHNGEKSHGIIGVIDVTDVMSDGNGRAWVHNNKQGFEDCEPYAQLEVWLSEKADEYLDKNVDKVQVEKVGGQYKPDHEWVQCDKCRKWRMLSSDFDSTTLPQEWFCYMKPFNGKCEVTEQKVARGVVTISTKRSGYNLQESPQEENEERPSQVQRDSSSSPIQEDGDSPPLKRLRKGLPRQCKKF